MKITIPKPCHENWEEMTPDERGRFCSVCSKSVRDFTDCSDEEVYHQLNSNPNICGRFTSSQMNKNIGFSVLSKLVLSLFVTSSVTGFLNAQSVNGKDVDKVDFRKGFEGLKVVNDTIGGSHWLGEPSVEQIKSTQPVIYYDGVKISEFKMRKLKSKNIESINILSGESAKVIYGKEGEYGAVIISGKKED